MSLSVWRSPYSAPPPSPTCSAITLTPGYCRAISPVRSLDACRRRPQFGACPRRNPARAGSRAPRARSRSPSLGRDDHGDGRLLVGCANLARSDTGREQRERGVGDIRVQIERPEGDPADDEDDHASAQILRWRQDGRVGASSSASVSRGGGQLASAERRGRLPEPRAEPGRPAAATRERPQRSRAARCAREQSVDAVFHGIRRPPTVATTRRPAIARGLSGRSLPLCPGMQTTGGAS